MSLRRSLTLAVGVLVSLSVQGQQPVLPEPDSIAVKDYQKLHQPKTEKT